MSKLSVVFTVGILMAIMLLLDGVYLTIMGKSFRTLIQTVQGSPMQIRVESVIACYIILGLGLYYFIIRTNAPILDAFLLGIFVYGVYDTTTYALLKSWRLDMAVMDMVWGGILFASTTYLYRRLIAE
jgi:uncharacterized membrane protein